VLFDMKKDINDLKKLVFDISENTQASDDIRENNSQILQNPYENHDPVINNETNITIRPKKDERIDEPIQESEVIEESLSLRKKEGDMICKALEKHKGRRKNAATELGISERTLYRKIKEYNLDQ
jgi:transcriptional regulator with PAS, ATPase and Fis domain